MDKELQLITSILGSATAQTFEGITIHFGKIGRHEVYVAKCGIGKVNSALSTYKLLKAISPEMVINSGVAGGAGLPIGNILLADRVAYSDVWCGPGTQYGEADGYPLFFQTSSKVLALKENGCLSDAVRTGLICTSDKFISTADEIKFIRSHFPDVCAVDMESASIGQTCIMEGVDFSIVRVVSDTPGEGENTSQYNDFWTDAPLKTFSTVRTIIENL